MGVGLRRDSGCSENVWLSILERLDINLEAVEVGELMDSVFVIERALENFGVVGSASKSD